MLCFCVYIILIVENIHKNIQSFEVAHISNNYLVPVVVEGRLKKYQEGYEKSQKQLFQND